MCCCCLLSWSIGCQTAVLLIVVVVLLVCVVRCLLFVCWLLSVMCCCGCCSLLDIGRVLLCAMWGLVECCLKLQLLINMLLVLFIVCCWLSCACDCCWLSVSWLFVCFGSNYVSFDARCLTCFVLLVWLLVYVVVIAWRVLLVVVSIVVRVCR